MIQLYDHFHERSRDLHFSLKEAGFTGPTVVINDDGFLPEGVTSPYSYFCQMESGTGKPLYFNQVPVPTFWEITGTNGEGEVWNYSQRRAKIFYAEPKYLRLVKNVDWYDQKGQVCQTDHYNQYGWLFARTHFNAKQEVTVRLYFNQAGQEVLVENFLTGDSILTWQGQTHFFENRVDLLRYFFKVKKWDRSAIWYNSLSTPFFLSYHLEEKGQDILFWQEGIGEDIPGNMKVLLKSNHLRTQRVLVQDRRTYEKMLPLLPPEQAAKLTYLGYIYPEKRSNQASKEILIVTNSDNLEQLDFLTQQLEDYRFHIAALTEMSQRLMAFDQRDNVVLYPNISQKQLASLYQTCDIYLDINHGGEVDQAVRRAFEHNHLILAFENTVHNRGLIPTEQVFAADQAERLVAKLRGSQADLIAAVADQRQKTSHESAERYQEILQKGGDS